MCEMNHERDNLTPETEYVRARREGQLRFLGVCWHAKYYIDAVSLNERWKEGKKSLFSFSPTNIFLRQEINSSLQISVFLCVNT